MNKFDDIKINVSETYRKDVGDHATLREKSPINSVPNSTNKVRKNVIRGVLKHDTSPSK